MLYTFPQTGPWILTVASPASVDITLDERGFPMTTLDGGTQLPFDEIPQAMKEARNLIQTLGTTAADHAWKDARKWMEKYFPNWS